MSLLEIKGLETEFQTEQGVVKALRGINYTVDRGEVLGIVGESGSGKSVGMLSLMGLLAPNGTVTAGEMIYINSGTQLDESQMLINIAFFTFLGISNDTACHSTSNLTA